MLRTDALFLWTLLSHAMQWMYCTYSWNGTDTFNLTNNDDDAAIIMFVIYNLTNHKILEWDKCNDPNYVHSRPWMISHKKYFDLVGILFPAYFQKATELLRRFSVEDGSHKNHAIHACFSYFWKYPACCILAKILPFAYFS